MILECGLRSAEFKSEMEEQRATLWCKLLGKVVEVVMVQEHSTSPSPGVPPGWRVRECLDKDVECFGKGCRFTTDAADSPFGEVGELPEGSSASFDPLAEPGVEGKGS